MSLYPTKTRLALLRAVDEGRVIDDLTDESTYLLDELDEPLKWALLVAGSTALAWAALRWHADA